jgi:hypothetical protein
MDGNAFDEASGGVDPARGAIKWGGITWIPFQSEPLPVSRLTL